MLVLAGISLVVSVSYWLDGGKVILQEQGGKNCAGRRVKVCRKCAGELCEKT